MLFLARISLPKYVVFFYVRSSLASIIAEVSAFFGHNISVIVSNKGKKSIKGVRYVSHVDAPLLKEYCINLIEHDSLRRVASKISDQMTESIVIVDEFHLCSSKTSQRAAYAVALASAAKHSVLLSATPSRSGDLQQMIPYLRMLSNTHITASNTLSAIATNSFNRHHDFGVEVVEHLEEMEIEASDHYWDLISSSRNPLGRSMDDSSNFNDLMKAILFPTVYEAMALKGVELAAEGGVFLTVWHASDCKYIYDLIVYKYGVDPVSVAIINSSNTFDLTPRAIQEGRTHDYKVVIGVSRNAQGYSLSALQNMIETVLPSNAAQRHQARGRILRSDTPYNVVNYHVIMAGLQVHLRAAQIGGDNVVRALKKIGVVTTTTSDDEINEVKSDTDEYSDHVPSDEDFDNLHLPERDFTGRVCIKKKALQERGYTDLEEWLQNPAHLYIGRNMEFYVPGATTSKWRNPFSVKKFGLERCLNLYEEYVTTGINPVTKKRRAGGPLLEDIGELTGKTLGCWCPGDNGKYHGDVLLRLQNQ
jgi:hypothetical protein